MTTKAVSDEWKWKYLAHLLMAESMQVDVPDDDGSPEAEFFRGAAEDLFGAEARRAVVIHDYLRASDPQPAGIPFYGNDQGQGFGR